LGICGGKFRLWAGLDELAMQNVVAAAQDEKGRPIANREQDYAENTDLKHRSTRNWCNFPMPCFRPSRRGRVIGAVSATVLLF
jgi:hypothetical protein